MLKRFVGSSLNQITLWRFYMNIQMQFCGLVVLIILLSFYLRHERIGLYTEKVFLWALETAIACVSLDILSVILIHNQDRLPYYVVGLGCKIYLISLIWTGCMALFYSSVDVFDMVRSNKIVKTQMTIAAVMSLIVFILPINIYHNGSVVYTYGESVFATYVFAFLMVFANVCVVFCRGRVMNPNRRRAVLTWMGIWIVASVIQFFNNQWLLVGFAISIGMVILFFVLENPESSIDRMTGFLNSTAFVEYVKQKYRCHEFVSGILISFEHSGIHDRNYELVEAGTYQIVEFLRSVDGAKIFRPYEKEFILMFKDRETFNNSVDNIRKRFKKSWVIDRQNVVNISPRYIVVPSGDVAESAEELITMLKYFRIQNIDSSLTEVVIDNEYVEKKREVDRQLVNLVDAMDDERVEVFF